MKKELSPTKQLIHRHQKKVLVLQSFLKIIFAIFEKIYPPAAAQIAISLFSRPFYRAKHQYSNSVLDSAEKSNLDFQGKKIRTYRWAGNSKKVLFIHGWASRGSVVHRLVPMLKMEGIEIIAFDAPAHGESSGSTLNLITFSQVCQKLIHRYGPFDAVITHSFGMRVGLHAYTELNITHPPVFVCCALPATMNTIFQQYLHLIQLPQKSTLAFYKKVNKILGRDYTEMDCPQLLERSKVPNLLAIHDIDDSIVNMEPVYQLLQLNAKVELNITKGLGHYGVLRDVHVKALIHHYLKCHLF